MGHFHPTIFYRILDGIIIIEISQVGGGIQVYCVLLANGNKIPVIPTYLLGVTLLMFVQP